MTAEERIDVGARALYADVAAEQRSVAERSRDSSAVLMGPWHAEPEPVKRRFRRWAQAVLAGVERPERNPEIRVDDWSPTR